MPNYAGAAAPLDPVAAKDPSYLAFMRGAGYTEAEVMADLARKQGGLTRQLERAKPRFADELRQAEQGVKTDFTNRGLYRSGARMVKQVDAGNVVRRNEQEFLSGIGDQRADLIADSMRQIAEGRRQAADLALETRSTLATEAANRRLQTPVGDLVGRSSVDPNLVNPPPNPTGGKPPKKKGPIRIPDLGSLGGLGG